MSLVDTWVNDRPTLPGGYLYGEGRRVLIAEDDEVMRTLLATALRGDGFEVVESRNGLELLDQVAPWLAGQAPPAPIDVIITDVEMPCFTGMEILAGLAEVRMRPAVVLITGFGDHRTHSLARALGAAAVFNKPFDVDDLRSLLVNLGPTESLPPGFGGGF